MSYITGGFVSGDIALRVKVYLTEAEMAKLRRLSAAGQEITVSFSRAGEAANTASSYYRQFGSAISSVNNLIVQMSITSFVFLLTLRQINSTQRQVATAQEQAAEAIRKYGRNSIQARQALRRLAQAQDNARIAQFGFYMQIIATIGSIATLVMRIPVLMAQLKALAASYSLVASAATSAKIAMGPGSWAALALGIGTAVTIGGIYLMGGVGASEAEFDRRWDEASAYVKRELRRRQVYP